jgi:hypothetical protein
MNLEQTIQAWKDDPVSHQWMNETFAGLVNATPELKEYRDWIEANVFGFGERSFIWMWKMLVDEMPKDFHFLEIGVFRGQVIGLMRMLSHQAFIIGITPLDSTDGHWESDYREDIKKLHNTFKLQQPLIFETLSNDPDTIREAGKIKYDCVYIDGGHTYDVVKQDIANYAPMVKIGGFLVIDDCANKYNMPWGYFQGIADVSRAVDEVLPNEQFTELFSVVHNRIFKRVK